MSLNINVTHDCKLLSINAKSYVSGASGSLQVTNYATGGTMSSAKTINFNGANGTGRVNISIADLSSPNGVFKVCLIENGIEQVCKPILIHCNLDCCLTKLTNELLECSCDCVRCSATLAKAQKIFLLLQAASSSVSIASTAQGSQNEGYYVDILEKYNKAVELCDSNCGCDC